MVEVLKRGNGNVFVGHHCFQWLLGEVTIGIVGCPQSVKLFDGLHMVFFQETIRFHGFRWLSYIGHIPLLQTNSIMYLDWDVSPGSFKLHESSHLFAIRPFLCPFLCLEPVLGLCCLLCSSLIDKKDNNLNRVLIEPLSDHCVPFVLICLYY